MISKINKPGRKSKAIIYAIGVHLLIIVVLGVSFDWKSHLAAAPAGQIEPIQATVVPEAALNEELAKIQKRDEDKAKAEEEQEQRIEDLIKEAEKIEADRKKKEEELVKIEEKRKAEEEKTKLLEQERLTKQKTEKEEQRKKEELAKKKAADEKAKKEEEERIAERKRKEEEDRKKKLAKAEQEKKRKTADEARKKADAERELQARLEAERMRSLAKTALLNNLGAIQRRVSRNWLQPQDFKSGQTAKVRVKVSPSGEVLEAKIVSGSGDPIFDRSVYNAVLKASPLPIPPDSRYYPHIQIFDFFFNPVG